MSLDPFRTPDGVYCMLALDHRDALRNAFRRAGVQGVSAEQMFQNMLKAVRSEGGFGQHAVVLTKDTRYLGEVPIQSW